MSFGRQDGSRAPLKGLSVLNIFPLDPDPSRPPLPPASRGDAGRGPSILPPVSLQTECSELETWPRLLHPQPFRDLVPLSALDPSQPGLCSGWEERPSATAPGAPPPFKAMLHLHLRFCLCRTPGSLPWTLQHLVYLSWGFLPTPPPPHPGPVYLSSSRPLCVTAVVSQARRTDFSKCS